MKQHGPMRVIISGGGTGGHVYPAIAIAEEIKIHYPEATIHFVGAEGKMEMRKVPKAGFPISGLPVRGLQRRLTRKNLSVPFRLMKSLWKSRSIIKEFKPDLAVGVGGYASGPLLWMASNMGIPTLIQEQNSFPGITNKWLGRKAQKICVAFPGMERFFPEKKIVFTGNPVRKDLIDISRKKQESQRFFDLGLSKTLLIFGGSLGARTLNEAVVQSESLLRTQEDVQVIWQCGETHYVEYKTSSVAQMPHVHLLPYLDRMDLAYAASDVVICRAGALTISELSVVHKAAVLVPSPNVAENHQAKNAMTLVEHKAARMVDDREARTKAIPEAIDILNQPQARQELEENVAKFAKPNAAELIVNEIENILNRS
jgi:UDP-N-acetylglucosamine--N-acetylmuramyl-(pentapeptide) pyrophosphoryl-undecaprenol N-acetylglucosamine transferase